MPAESGKLNWTDARRRLARAASSFDGANFIHTETCSGLIERLSPLVIDAALIVDLGSATGAGSRRLAGAFRKARILSVDRSAAMLRAARRNRSRFSRVREVVADALQLPLPTGAVDLVFANLLLPWIDDLPGCFAEIARVLRKGGVFAFATLGPDSLAVLRHAWGAADPSPHVRAFADMHDVGDALVHAGLAEPVLDTDRLTVTYGDSQALFRDLTASGARNCLSGRRASLTGKTRFRAMQQALEGPGPLAVELELVYGHAWGVGPRPAAGEFLIEPNAIGRPGRR